MPSSECFLCQRPLTPIEGSRNGLQEHPVVDDCLVRVTDSWGIATPSNVCEPDPAAQRASVGLSLGELPDELPSEEPDDDDDVLGGDLAIKVWDPVDVVLPEIFANAGVPRLGGQSSGRGWTSVSLFQRCPHLWASRYHRSVARVVEPNEAPGRAIGSLIHTFLAIHYMRLIDAHYPLTPEQALKALERCNPQFVQDAWRVFIAYRVYYSREKIQPLAVEYDLRDPRTNESCRFDLVAFFPKAINGHAAGTYCIDHKSVGIFLSLIHI